MQFCTSVEQHLNQFCIAGMVFNCQIQGIHTSLFDLVDIGSMRNQELHRLFGVAATQGQTQGQACALLEVWVCTEDQQVLHHVYRNLV